VVRLIADGRPGDGRSWLSQCQESWVLTSRIRGKCLSGSRPFSEPVQVRQVASVVTSLPWHPPQAEGGWHRASAGGQRRYWRTVLT
jgi:hypothetical protein